MGLRIAQVFLLLAPIVAIGVSHEDVADTSHSHHHHKHHHPHHHHANDDDGTVEVALDKRGGASHIRREGVDPEPTAMHAARPQHPKHRHHQIELAQKLEQSRHKDDASPSLIASQEPVEGGDGDPEGPAEREMDAEKLKDAQKDENSLPAKPKLKEGEDSMEDAERAIKKSDMVATAAEEKAGLPDTTKTTPEPVEEGERPMDETNNALMIGVFSLAVIVGSAAAAWSVWMARRMQAKHAEGLTAGDAGEEAAGEEAEPAAAS